MEPGHHRRRRVARRTAAQGWTGSVQAVRHYVRPFRQRTAAPPPAVPKTRQITGWLLSRPASLDPGELAQLAGIRARCPHIDALAAHVTSFAEMMTNRTGEQQLPGWLAAVQADDQPHLHSFAAGIRRDQDAVTAGSPCPTAQAPLKATSTRSRCSNARCTAEPDSPCYLFSELRGQRCSSGGCPATAADYHRVRKAQFGRSIAVWPRPEYYRKRTCRAESVAQLVLAAARYVSLSRPASVCASTVICDNTELPTSLGLFRESANASSSTPDNHHHGIRARAE